MILIGLARIGNEPVLRYTADGKPILDISLAFDYGKRGQDGKRQTQWVNGTMWNDRAEKLASHLSKGQLAFVTIGDPHIEEFTRNDGSKGTSLRGRINEFEFAGAAKKDAVKEESKTPYYDPADIVDNMPF